MNRHKVPKRQWKKWTGLQQLVFNDMYETLLNDQEMFLHPKADPSRQEYWKTTAWNTAWLAADSVQTCLKVMAGDE